MPKVVKKRRKLEETEGQTGVAWEEYFDYIFPDDQTQQPNFKLLAMAHAWRQQVCMTLSTTRNNYMVLILFSFTIATTAAAKSRDSRVATSTNFYILVY